MVGIIQWLLSNRPIRLNVLRKDWPRHLSKCLPSEQFDVLHQGNIQLLLLDDRIQLRSRTNFCKEINKYLQDFPATKGQGTRNKELFACHHRIVFYLQTGLTVYLLPIELIISLWAALSWFVSDSDARPRKI